MFAKLSENFLLLRYMRCLSFLFLIILLSCCNKRKDVDLIFNRFEKFIFNVSKKNNLLDLEENFGTFNDVFKTQIIQQGNISDSVYIKELIAFTNHSDMREAYDSTAALYTDINDIKKDLNYAFSQAKFDFPELPTPTITTFFGGFNYGVITYDNNIAIGLENFLGENSKFYMLLRDPQYLRFQKQRKFISSNVIEVWINEYFEAINYDSDFLSQMLYKGKIMYCIDRMLPDSRIEDRFRFSKKEMEWVVNNELNIWTYFIDNELIYSSYEQDFRSFLHYAPFSRGMPSESPSRVAYFIGYQIIKEFMRRTDISVYEMMKLTDSREILRKSKYKPSK